MEGGVRNVAKASMEDQPVGRSDLILHFARLVNRRVVDVEQRSGLIKKGKILLLRQGCRWSAEARATRPLPGHQLSRSAQGVFLRRPPQVLRQARIRAICSMVSANVPSVFTTKAARGGLCRGAT